MNKDLASTTLTSITDIMNSPVITINVDDSIADVEKFITEHKLSFLPVVDIDNQCFGVISDYDLIKFHRSKGDSKLEHIWEICSHSVIQVSKETSIEQAANLLIDNRVHHLIVSENHSIIGIASAIDLLKYFTTKS